ncbi:molybdate ABC transporter permease subunit [bacterium (Candidatus Blackallbacteria) CG17_big_fil_post_rev_8_21_14_2_50_48_46]|uniref:Molybdenum transport system permease n=1 Tax=bacterium (Candidatus Blackallbacteria) CG17_big_fil_post_rev_8_21_14_2_50_48_46 TaxID=2014261 RepID=A0A2M7G0H5_9BACT|nr:MAG: molybdate ABC transporter permease subunit [bacterium (Candidatus Blackallbacteria) CG18_big_fil_WC_8_21_14_2_50_49_26]PIW15104.1 MAG: molybdate ABC transporter permease subunit [bacterium (Candidatus Blackallbacteria) CG17_big_fil_post_rev_8_21_14_2_50_48_46]PIW47662.1 MAG: molybdate ABC transporter permease subunit [bacterium (Candidatus Blackallbacteria) CG13_big_fil_rev_8_21_14_2_50_49_14]
MSEFTSFGLSLKLAFLTALGLLPLALFLGRFLAFSQKNWRGFCEAGLMLPLVLPPTVMGYYLLLGLGQNSWLGGIYAAISGKTLVFSFEGILLASWLFNLPFAVQPIQRAFAAIPHEIREAAACCGLSNWQAFWRVEWPLAWPGILSSLLLCFAHTLGEFGVVLMVGGNIPGETQTLSLLIYDKVQALDFQGARGLSLGLLVFSFLSLAAMSRLEKRKPVQRTLSWAAQGVEDV